MRQRKQRVKKTPSLQQHEYRDRFEVIGKIPANKSYQWVARSVLGNEEIVEHLALKMKNGGWAPVPPRRHPKMPKRGRRIECGGQVLMERSRELTEEAFAREKEKAQALLRDADTNRHGFSQTISDTAFSSVEPYVFDSKAVDAAKQKLPSVGGAYYVEVPLLVLISHEEIETAVSVLHLDPAEYMRRRIIMDTEALMRAVPESHRLHPSNAIFRRAQIRAHKETKS